MKYRFLTQEEKKNLKEGDEVAIGTSWGIHDGIYPDLLGMDTHVNLWGGDTLESKTEAADLYIKTYDDESERL